MTRTFQEASREIQASLQKHLEKAGDFKESFDSSDDNHSDNDEADKNNGYDEILERVFNTYDLGSHVGVDSRTREALLSSISSSSCLICISGVKKRDPIWSCQECHCVFHLPCIQRWSRDSIFQQKNELENENGFDLRHRPRQGKEAVNQVLKWGCPKCRSTYEEKDIPTRYTCFCGKVVDPEFDPWIVPHSCGETCGRKLKPDCGHQCLILCHPGPCPPCPKNVKARCFCGQTAPATKRCFDKLWSCGKPCNKELACGQHTCPVPCHEGDCPPCSKKSVQLCQCQRHQRECACSDPDWSCQEKCGVKLECGYHMCELVCHVGECPPCPLSQLRSCPCGKNQYKLPCTQATPTCGDTCGKTLGCGSHVCAERCHRGACGSCLQMVVKKCKCGLKKKEVPCAKEYTCDAKCKKLKDCRKHNCNRKCCLGDCPPCDQHCNKSLACKNHKCSSRCHRGSCYPCTLTKEVSCSCGKSKVLVPCGMEKSTKPPRCRLKCKIPPDCHHDSRMPHSCHFGQCPPCRQVCGEKMACGHDCPMPCHDQVLVTVEDKQKAATPWEFKGPKTEMKSMDCPECQFPVPVTCLGLHVTDDWPCSVAKSASCGRPCGRQLPCQNHTCVRECHRVKNAPDLILSGSNCTKCNEDCKKPRPEGCHHPCLKPCHPGDCASCPQMMKVWCHCKITQLYVKCGEWISDAVPEESKLEMACCKDQCPKLMSCGHRCVMICHPGDCSDRSQCKKKVKLYCPCKRRKQESQCKTSDNVKVECDSECNLLREKAKAEQDKLKQQKQEEEERQQREEAERFENSLAGKGRKHRRQRRHHDEEPEPGFFAKNKIWLLAILVSVIGVLVYFWAASEETGSEPAPAPSAKGILNDSEPDIATATKTSETENTSSS